MGVFDFKEFVFRSNKVLPTEYDDALSYYEVLGKVANHLNNVIDATNALADSLVSPYDSNVNYEVGDYVWYNKAIWKCSTANYGAFNQNDWGGNPVVFVDAVADDIQNLEADVNNFESAVNTIVAQQRNIIERTIAGLAPTYNPAESYSVGEYVSYIGTSGAIIYKCIGATTGAFDETKWTAVVAFDEFFDYIDSKWSEFFENYTRTWGIVQTTGTSQADAMSQNATTVELLKRMCMKGTLPSGSIADISEPNSIYALISSNTYDDYPGSSVTNGFVVTINNVTMWAQYFITYTTQTTGSTGMGEIWYRSGADRNYNPWNKINIKPLEMRQETGTSSYYPMSQNATTVELLKRMDVRGVLANNTDLNTINENCIWILDSARSYTNSPVSGAGLLFTTKEGNIKQQLFYFYTSSGTNYGVQWYRNALSNTWRSWIKVTDPTVPNLRLAIKNYNGTAENPVSLYSSSHSPVQYSSFITPTWVTEVINNIATASSIIKFGANSLTNSAVLGVEKTSLKAFVHSPNTNSGDNAYAYGTEKSATIKLTSFSKKLYTFGDSITWGRNGDISSSSDPKFRVTKTFASVIQRNLGITAINWGVGSQGWLAVGGNDRTALQEINAHNIGDGDYFSLAWGVNDLSHIQTGGQLDTSKLGEYTDTDGNTLMAQVYQCVNRLYTINPKSQTILIKPWNGRNIGTFPHYKFGNSAYAALIAELKKFADYYYLPWIGDDCPLAGFGMLSGSLMGTDGVHPNEKGYEFIGNWLSGQLGKIIG